MSVIQLTVRCPIDVVEAVLDFFLNRASITFEGDVSQVDWTRIPHANVDGAPLGVAEVPITNETLDALKGVLRTIGLRSRVAHVVVRSGHRRLFASYDSFGEGMTVIECDEQQDLFHELNARGLVRTWRVKADDG